MKLLKTLVLFSRHTLKEEFDYISNSWDRKFAVCHIDVAISDQLDRFSVNLNVQKERVELRKKLGVLIKH